MAAVQKSLGRKCFTQLIVSEDPKERGATAKEPGMFLNYRGI